MNHAGSKLKTKRIRNYVRIVWTIGAKDIAEALRNRATVVNIIVVLGIMVAYRWFPAMAKKEDTFLVIYDAGRSSLSAKLEESPEFNPLQATTMEEFTDYLDDYDVWELGLAIPADFDRRLASGEPAELEGYATWSNRGIAAKQIAEYETRLSDLIGRSVGINFAGALYPQPDSMGPIRWAAISAVLVIFFMSALLVPNLMLEERQTKTLEALLVSPASIVQTVLGKALAGLFYCTLVAFLVIVFNWDYVVSWGLAILAVVCALLFAVGFGLLAGSFCQTKQQLMAWSLIPAQFLLVPVFLTGMEPILPDAIRAAIPWIPTVAQAILFRYAFSFGAIPSHVLTHLGVALTGGILMLMFVAWRVGRSNR